MSDSEKDQRLSQQQPLPRETELRCPDPESFRSGSPSGLAQFVAALVGMLRRTKNDRF